MGASEIKRDFDLAVQDTLKVFGPGGVNYTPGERFTFFDAAQMVSIYGKQGKTPPLVPKRQFWPPKVKR